MFVRYIFFFFALGLPGIVGGCRPEPVPIVATYEPVDCECPSELMGGEPEPSEPEPSGAESERAPEPEPEPEESGAEPEPDSGRKSGDDKSDASREENEPETPAAEEPAELEPPIALDRRIDLNTASEAELVTLPRIGPSKARRIIDYRNERPFRRTKDLMRIKGIGPATFRKLQDDVVVRPVARSP